MNKPQLVITFSLFLCLLITMTQIITAAPAYSDYDQVTPPEDILIRQKTVRSLSWRNGKIRNIRDLYELILKKELLGNDYEQSQPRLVRKNTRSPSLRLRFGRRSDPSFYQYNPRYNVNGQHQDQHLSAEVSNEK